MNIEYKVQVNESPEVIEDRLVRFYIGIGYRQAGTGAESLTFRRGSVVRALFSFSPKTWKTVVTGRIARCADGKTETQVSYNINSTGQTVVQGVIDFWNAELTALDEAVGSGYLRPEDNRVADRAAIRDHWGCLGRTILLMSIAMFAIVPLMLPSILLVKPAVRLLGYLLPMLGADGVSLTAAIVLLLTFAAILLYPVPQLSAKMTDTLGSILPRRAVRPVQVMVLLLFWGLFLGMIWIALAMVEILHSDKQLLILGGVIVGGLAIALIHDRREKRAKKAVADSLQ